MSSEPENIEIELAALADGTLPAERCEQLLALVAERPELAAELERQRHALAIVGTLESIQAPSVLRRSIETLRAGESLPASARSAGSARLRRPMAQRGPVRLRLQAAAALTLAAVAAAAVTVALTTGGSGGPGAAPTVLQASRVALAPSTRAAPAENPHDSRLLTVSAAGIPYPYWGGRLGWEAIGARTDTVGGRTVTTVFYADRSARRIGYSIVSGAALPVPAGSATVERHGVRFHVVRAAGPTILTWREAGHTCILTARAVTPRALVRLAAWERT
jgi:anti-sigma factor RsiW